MMAAPGCYLAAWMAAPGCMCGRTEWHGMLGNAWEWLGMHDFHPLSTFDQFSSILYDFCMISTIPNNSTQKHKFGENSQLYTK